MCPCHAAIARPVSDASAPPATRTARPAPVPVPSAMASALPATATAAGNARAAGSTTGVPATPVPARAGEGALTLTLPMRHAGQHRVVLRYALHVPAGDAGHDAPLVVLAGGICAGRRLVDDVDGAHRGWAHRLLDDGAPLDSRRHRLLAFDYVGAEGDINAPIDTADQADALALLLQALGLPRLSAFVGYSYGALVGLQFAARHPAALGSLVAVSGTHRAHPYASAWRALQRRAFALGQLQCDATQGLVLARQLAMLAYRTPEEFATRFAAPAEVRGGQVRVAAEDYLDAAGARFASSTSASGWLRLSESIDLHRVDPAQVRCPTTVVAVAGDRLVPLAEAVDLVEALGGRGRLRVVRSDAGHDAFLVDRARIDPVLRGALAGIGGAA